MKTVLWMIVAWAALFVPAGAQTFDLINLQLYEPLIGSSTIHHARAVALGGNVAALVNDGSALWHNPAALGRVRNLSLSCDLEHGRIRGESLPLSVEPWAPPPTVTATDEKLSRTRVGALYVAVPLQGHRTPWTVGFGVAITHNLDRALAGRLRFAPGDFVDTLDADPANFVAEQIEVYGFTEDQRGVVRAWQAGIGGELSPEIHVGIAGVYYEGDLELISRTTFTGTRFEDTSVFAPGIPVRWDLTSTADETFDGIGAHLGILAWPADNVALAAVIRSPVKFDIDLDFLATEQRDQGTVVELPVELSRRSLRLPLSITLAAAVRMQQVRLSADLSVTDWSQVEYDESPYLTQFNDLLRRTYDEAWGLGLGVEWDIPQSTAALRAGLRTSGLPYAGDRSVDNRLAFSGGAGFAVTPAVRLDLALAWERCRGANPVFGFDERYSRLRGVVTASYSI